MKNILITGSNGLLGQTLVNKLKDSEYKIHAISRGENLNKGDFNYYDVDITQKNELLQLIDTIKPNYIINAAAMTNVDYCENHQQECDAINVEAVKTLIVAAQKHNTHLVHISTDFVFDGTTGNYKEDDQTNPLSYYGLSKLKSEKLFKETSVSYTILRTILVFGFLPHLKQKNILLWLLEKMANKTPLTMVNDQLRMPTYVEDLATACIAAIQTRQKGLYHISSTDMMNMYDLTLAVADVFNYKTDLISAIPTEKLHQPAKRPKITGFNITKAQKDLNFTPKRFKSALQEIKIKIKQSEC